MTRLDRRLAVVGTLLVWLPIAATLLTSLMGSLPGGSSWAPSCRPSCSSRSPPASGWPRVVVITALAVYTGALVATGVGGGALLRDLAGVGRG